MERFVHGGNVYAERPSDGEWLDFSANINPLGIADGVRREIIANVDGLVHYPDPDGREIKQAIAEYYQVPEKNLLLGNGAAELFYLYFNTLRHRNVLIPVPSFSEYERAAVAAGAEPVFHYLAASAGFLPDWEALLPKLAFMDCLIIGNPNNPTGCLVSRDEIEHCLRAAAKLGVMVLIDESFMDFRSDGDRYTVRGLLEQFDNLVIFHSLTKFYALPGLRLGFALANAALVKRLEQGKDQWNMNLLAQKAGRAALLEADYQEKTCCLIQTEGDYLTGELATIGGLRVFKPSVNFILFNTRQRGVTAGELTARAKKQGILLRDCSNYPGLDDYYVRIAVRNHEENCLLVNCLKKLLG